MGNFSSSLFRSLIVCILIGLSVPGDAAKVYKWINEDGSVTYRDKPPPVGAGGDVELKELDSNSNVIQYEALPEQPKPGSKKKGGAGNGGSAAGKDDDRKPDYLKYDEEKQRQEKLEIDNMDEAAKQQRQLEQQQQQEQLRLKEEARQQEIQRHNNRFKPF